MGQKVNPHGLRVGVIKDWDSKWYAGKKNFADNLIEDNKVRQYITKKLYAAGVAKVVIERASGNKLRANVMTAKPGMVIGRSGDGIDAIKKDLAKLTGKEVEIEIIEIRRPELDAQLSAEAVAQSLERRTSFRRAMKQQISRTMKAGAKGIKVVVSGRLGGAEIARSEKYSEGNVPLHTLRADIDYGFAEADTTYGRIGVKVWINHGEVLDKGLKSAIPEEKREKKGDKRQRREGGRRDGSRQDRREGRRNDRFQKEEAPKATPRIRRTPKPAPVEAPQEVEAQEPMETTEA